MKCVLTLDVPKLVQSPLDILSFMIGLFVYEHDSHLYLNN